MMSLRLKDGEDAAKAFTAKLRVFKRATSLGSVESLAEHRASVEGPGTTVSRPISCASRSASSTSTT